MKENNGERKVITISFGKFVAIAACLILVAFVGMNVYANSIGKPNAISAIQALFEKNVENTDEIARELFEKASYEIRVLSYSSLESNYKIAYPLVQKDIGEKTYYKTSSKYEEVEQKYKELFAEEALQEVLNKRFLNVDGELYLLSEGTTVWNTEILNLEKTNDKDNELTYKVTYCDTDIDGNNKEELTCNFKIKKVNGTYKLIQTNYLNLDKIGGIQEYQEEINTENESADSEELKEDSKTNATKKDIETTNNKSTLCGDVNGDGTVNLKDVAFLQQYLSGMRDLPEQQKLNADVNSDEKITNVDESIINGYLVGKYSKLPWRISGTEYTKINIPGMSIKYPILWDCKKVNESVWENNEGGESLVVTGDIEGAEIIITFYEPEYISNDYKEVVKVECQKHGATYYDRQGEAGYNIGSTDPNFMEWRSIIVESNREVIYINVNNVGYVRKVKVVMDNLNDSNKRNAFRVIDEMLVSGITGHSY